MMFPERWRLIEEFYHLAREHGPQALSGAPVDISREVERLLAEDGGGRILDQPAAELLPALTALGVGSQVGSYQIDCVLGAGGMGQVFGAYDSRLKRRVALKVLPAAFLDQPERLARFQREAEVLAQFNHPNIAQIYGAEENVLIMEFVDGEAPKGPLPFDEAWKIALQIAGALEYAHERGVIHRDLKPANVKVTRDGHVKLLDFGLARIFGGAAENSPAPDPEETSPGVLLGTPSYMSPEQAKGKPLDRRTDIWSWGVVLYQLLTGEQLFHAENVSETIARVLTLEPDLTRVPPQVRRLLATCLERDPKRRLRDIGDAPQMLDSLETPAAPVRARLPWTLAAISTAAALLLGIGWLVALNRKAAVPVAAIRYELSVEYARSIHSFAISPDGRELAIAADVNGTRQLWLRRLDALHADPLPNTEDAQAPFWSPDGRQIGFFAEGKLKKIDAAGGAAIAICDALDGRSGSWSRDNVIIFARYSAPPARILRVAASGGTPAEILKAGDLMGSPTFLPDGKRFLMNFETVKEKGIYLVMLDGKDSHRILAEGSSFVLTPGWILFVRAKRLMAQPFDAERGQVNGDAVPVEEGVSLDALYNPSFSVSPAGVLVFERDLGIMGKSQLTWQDRSGKVLGTAGRGGQVFDPAISPDQRLVAFRSITTAFLSDLWLWDLSRGSGQRITTDPSMSLTPHWSPQGDRLAFTSSRGEGNIYVKAAGGTGEDQLLLADQHPNFISDWSPDGRYIVYAKGDPKTKYDLYLLPVSGVQAGTPQPFLVTEFNEFLGQVSPDGRWMAYVSDQSRQREVYVRRFPAGDGEWKVSVEGGDQPRWRRDGKELFFVRSDGTMMAAAIRTTDGSGPAFAADTPQRLFPTHLAQTARGIIFQYDVAPDGQRFLLNSTVEGSASASPLTVVVNWTAGLRH
jgi:Tol biopolymer transport system component